MRIIKTAAFGQSSRPNPIGRLVELATKSGWRYESAVSVDKEQFNANPKAFSYGGSTYPTLASPDGNVTIALSPTNLFLHNGNVWVGDSSDVSDNRVTLHAIHVQPAARSKGYATQAIKLLASWADKLGMTVVGEPVEMHSLKGKTGRTTKQLREWYKRHGWERRYPDTDRILEYRPKAGNHLEERP